MIVGLTGGIGAGKSTVLELFKELGVPVIKYDEMVHDVYKDPEVISTIKMKFGDSIIKDGAVDRKALGKIAFQDPAILTYLEQEIGPLAMAKVKDFKKQNLEKPYIIMECAKLLDTSLHDNCELTILVTADESIRIERAMERDNASEADIRVRMKFQMSQDKMHELSDLIIENNGSESLLAQVYNTNTCILEILNNW